MRRRWRWLVGLAVAVAILAVAARLALPGVVRWAVVRQLREATGREATIDEVRLGVRAGRLHLGGVRVLDKGGAPPFLELAALDLRLHWASLLRGVVRLTELSLAAPTVRLVRLPDGGLDLPGRAGGGGGLPVVLDRLRLADGRLSLEDRTLAPPRTIEASAIRIDAEGVPGPPGAAPGRAEATLVLAGAPLTVAAPELALAPFRARARVDLGALDLGVVWAYLSPASALRPEGGRATLRLEASHGPDGTRLDGEVGLIALLVRLAGQAEPLIAADRVTVAAQDVTLRAGVVRLGRVTLTGDPTVVDGSRAPPRRYALAPLRVALEDAALAPGAPGRLRLEAALPDGARLEAAGPVDLAGRQARLAVVLRGVDARHVAAYVPAAWGITPSRGRFAADVDLGYEAPSAFHAGGQIRAADLVLDRLDRQAPFVRHRRLALTVKDLGWRDGALRIGRLVLAGDPHLMDPTMSPPLDTGFSALTLTGEDVTWPSRGPARVRLDGTGEDGGRLTVAGTFDPGTLGTSLRATLAGFDVTRAAGYLPPASPVTIARGRLGARLAFAFDRARGMRLGVDGALDDLAVRQRDEAEPFLEDRRLSFSVADLALADGQLGIGGVTVAGAPTYTDRSVEPSRQVTPRSLALTVRNLAWPARGPTLATLTVALPEAGTLEARASADLDARRATVDVALRDAALGPLTDWLPITGPLAGTAEAEVRGTLGWSGPFATELTGALRGRGLTLGPADRPVLRLAALDADGLDVRWPASIGIERLTLRGLAAVLERDANGFGPVRNLLVRARRAVGVQASAPGASPPAAPADAPAAGGAGPAGPVLRIGEAAIEDGALRFLDQTTAPFYSEEVTRLVLRLRGFTTAPDQADLVLQGVVGATGSMDLRGRIAPFGRPFFLDLTGELHDFPLARTNPQFRRLFAWILRRGSLTSRVHYRVVGDQVEALHDVQVERLGVERDRSPGAGKSSLPLDLIVAIATDAGGNISFPLPVTGRLGSPEFSLGGAIWAGIRNALVNLVSVPFTAIGKLFRRGDAEPDLRVDPLEFAAGAAVVTPDGAAQLQRLADFLRATPRVALELRAVVTDADRQALRTQATLARIQEAQRTRGLPSLDAAARQLFREALPDRATPETLDEVVGALRDRELPSEDEGRDLGRRRLEAVRADLVAHAGVPAARLRLDDTPTPARDGAGRIEFALAPEERTP